MEPEYDLVASHTQLNSFLSCERKYTYHYRDKWAAPVSSRAMTLGTTGHHLLDLWWTGTLIDDITLDDITEYVIALEETSTIEDCVSIAEHALWLLRRYDRMYARDRETTSVIGVEQNYTFALPDLGERKYALTAKIDKLLDSKQHGGIVFMDHKFVGKQDQADWLDISPQFSIYHLALRQNGVDAICSLLDSVYTYRRKAKKEFLEWDAYPVEESFVRALVDRDDKMLDVVAAEAYRVCDRMWHLRQGHYEPVRNVSPACMWCEFRAPCFESLRGDDVGEKAMLEEYFGANKKRPPVALSSPLEVEI
jgi:hypothetical protein